MTPNLHAGQPLLLRKFTDLKSVPCREKDLVSSPLQFADNRNEQRHMRRIVHVYPELYSRAVVRRGTGAVRTSRTTDSGEGSGWDRGRAGVESGAVLGHLAPQHVPATGGIL